MRVIDVLLIWKVHNFFGIEQGMLTIRENTWSHLNILFDDTVDHNLFDRNDLLEKEVEAYTFEMSTCSKYVHLVIDVAIKERFKNPEPNPDDLPF